MVRSVFLERVGRLTPRVQAILIARSFGVSLRHLGRALGLSAERVRQLEARGWRALAYPWRLGPR